MYILMYTYICIYTSIYNVYFVCLYIHIIYMHIHIKITLSIYAYIYKVDHLD